MREQAPWCALCIPTQVRDLVPLALNGSRDGAVNSCGCFPVVSSVSDFSDSQFTCDIGPGIGANFRFLIREFIVAPIPFAGYTPPSVVSISQSTWNVTGAEVTLYGSSFGSMACDGLSRVFVNLSSIVHVPVFNTSNGVHGFTNLGTALVKSAINCSIVRLVFCDNPLKCVDYVRPHAIDCCIVDAMSVCGHLQLE